MMREREQQDRGCFGLVKEESHVVQGEKAVKKEEVKQDTAEPKGNCYSLSDATPTKKTA
jgi:hypothetical protein